MNPTPQDIDLLIRSKQLAKALRGDACVFVTPAEINDDMRPTDHDELLAKCIYPLVAQYDERFITLNLEAALVEICVDALGVFCAHQCFYLEVLRESSNESPLHINRDELPKILGQRFVEQIPFLHTLELRKGDAQLDRPYRLIRSQMRILATRHAIDFGIPVDAF